MRHPWLFKSPEGTSQTNWLIGWRYKHGNVFSLPVLISREAWPYYCFYSETSHLSITLCMADDDFPGDHREAETPVPIPNTTVKRFFANGTAVRLWESRSSPGLFFYLLSFLLFSSLPLLYNSCVIFSFVNYLKYIRIIWKYIFMPSCLFVYRFINSHKIEYFVFIFLTSIHAQK